MVSRHCQPAMSANHSAHLTSDWCAHAGSNSICWMARSHFPAALRKAAPVVRARNIVRITRERFGELLDLRKACSGSEVAEAVRFSQCNMLGMATTGIGLASRCSGIRGCWAVARGAVSAMAARCVPGKRSRSISTCARQLRDRRRD